MRAEETEAKSGASNFRTVETISTNMANGFHFGAHRWPLLLKKEGPLAPSRRTRLAHQGLFHVGGIPIIAVRVIFDRSGENMSYNLPLFYPAGENIRIRDIQCLLLTGISMLNK